MTDRRRNLFVLAARRASCSLASTRWSSLTKPTRQGLDLKGGVVARLPGQADQESARSPPTPSSARWTSCASASTSLGVAEPEIQRSGSRPDRRVRCQTSRTPTGGRAGRHDGAMWFYDWEASVLGPDCKPDPANPNVTGGSSAGHAGRRHPDLLRGGHPRRRSARRPTSRTTRSPGLVLLRRQQGQDGALRARESPRPTCARGLPRTTRTKPTSDRQGPAGLRHRPGRGRRLRQGAKRAADAYYVLKDEPSLARHATSRTPSRTSTTARRQRPARTSPSTSPTRAARSGRRRRARSPSAARPRCCRAWIRATPPTSTSRSSSTTS